MTEELILKIRSQLDGLGLDFYHLEFEGSHLKVFAVSNMFDEMRLLQRQQYILKALKDFVSSGEVHAIHVKTFNNESWKSERLKYGII